MNRYTLEIRNKATREWHTEYEGMAPSRRAFIRKNGFVNDTKRLALLPDGPVFRVRKA